MNQWSHFLIGYRLFRNFLFLKLLIVLILLIIDAIVVILINPVLVTIAIIALLDLFRLLLQGVYLSGILVSIRCYIAPIRRLVWLRDHLEGDRLVFRQFNLFFITLIRFLVICSYVEIILILIVNMVVFRSLFNRAYRSNRLLLSLIRKRGLDPDIRPF